MNEIKVGDVVRLKSGGNGPTVMAVDGDRIRLIWTEWGRGHEWSVVRDEWFPAACFIMFPSLVAHSPSQEAKLLTALTDMLAWTDELTIQGVLPATGEHWASKTARTVIQEIAGG